jgi:hypothetical protein
MTVVVVSVTTLGAGVPRIPARSHPGCPETCDEPPDHIVTTLGSTLGNGARGTPRNRRQRVLSALS